MSKKIICPLKFSSKENECTSDCAWNVGSEVKPKCAIAEISLCLTSIDENNNSLIFNPTSNED